MAPFQKKNSPHKSGPVSSTHLDAYKRQALMAMKRLKKDGILDNMEESDEINACSIVAVSYTHLAYHLHDQGRDGKEETVIPDRNPLSDQSGAKRCV